jgi:hypothetical protein
VNAFAPRLSRRVDDLVDTQVALRRGRWSYGKRFVGHPHVQRRAVDVRIHRHGADAHLAQSSDDADGDLASIGDEDFAHRD